MRFAVYETVRAFVRDVCKTFEIEFAEIVKFGSETSLAEFLFELPVLSNGRKACAGGYRVSTQPRYTRRT
jgi:hypothetical protein